MFVCIQVTEMCWPAQARISSCLTAPVRVTSGWRASTRESGSLLQVNTQQQNTPCLDPFPKSVQLKKNVTWVLFLVGWSGLWSHRGILLKSTSLAGVFGQRLEETVLYERRYGVRLVPLVVEQCVTFIRERGLHEVGLFRQPGQTSLVKELQEAFDAGERPSFDRYSLSACCLIMCSSQGFRSWCVLSAVAQTSTRWHHCWSSTSDSCRSLWFPTATTRTSCCVERNWQVTAHR